MKETPAYSIKEEPVLHPNMYLLRTANRRAALGLSKRAWLGDSKKSLPYLPWVGFFLGIFVAILDFFIFGQVRITPFAPSIGMGIGGLVQFILERQPLFMHTLPPTGILLDGCVVDSGTETVEVRSENHFYHYVEYRFIGPENLTLNGRVTS